MWQKEQEVWHRGGFHSDSTGKITIELSYISTITSAGNESDAKTSVKHIAKASLPAKGIG